MKILALVGVATLGTSLFTTAAPERAAEPLRPLSAQAVARAHDVASDAALERASVRPALGLEIGRSTRADLRAWLSGTGNCQHDWTGRTWRCDGVARPGEPSIDRLTARFDATGALASLEVTRAHLGLAEARSALLAATARLEPALAPTESIGDGIEQPYARIARSYAYADYNASVVASNLGRDGLRVHEHYRGR